MIEPAYRTESTVTEDGALNLRGLPFQAGEALEVILIRRARGEGSRGEVESLRGSVLRYDDPTTPVAEEDWELGG